MHVVLQTAMGANVGYFIGDDDGSARTGALDNRTACALHSAKQGGGTFYVGLQRVSGDSAWERSWQVRYDHNFACRV